MPAPVSTIAAWLDLVFVGGCTPPPNPDPWTTTDLLAALARRLDGRLDDDEWRRQACRIDLDTFERSGRLPEPLPPFELPSPALRLEGLGVAMEVHLGLARAPGGSRTMAILAVGRRPSDFHGILHATTDDGQRLRVRVGPRRRSGQIIEVMGHGTVRVFTDIAPFGRIVDFIAPDRRADATARRIGPAVAVAVAGQPFGDVGFLQHFEITTARWRAGLTNAHCYAIIPLWPAIAPQLDRQLAACLEEANQPADVRTVALALRKALRGLRGCRLMVPLPDRVRAALRPCLQPPPPEIRLGRPPVVPPDGCDRAELTRRLVRTLERVVGAVEVLETEDGGSGRVYSFIRRPDDIVVALESALARRLRAGGPVRLSAETDRQYRELIVTAEGVVACCDAGDGTVRLLVDGPAASLLPHAIVLLDGRRPAEVTVTDGASGQVVRAVLPKVKVVPADRASHEMNALRRLCRVLHGGHVLVVDDLDALCAKASELDDPGSFQDD